MRMVTAGSGTAVVAVAPLGNVAGYVVYVFAICQPTLRKVV